MIICITDAKGLTRKVELAKQAGMNVSDIYRTMFRNHIEGIPAGDIQWKIIKTTGDGLLITASKQKEDQGFFHAWCQAMMRVFESFQDPEIRIVAHYCQANNQELVMGLDLGQMSDLPHLEDLNEFLSHIKHDIFGPQINLLFRLSQMISGRVFVITEELLERGLDNEGQQTLSKKEAFTVDGFVFGPPVPITFMKGVDWVSFSDTSGNHRPVWLWEVNRHE